MKSSTLQLTTLFLLIPAAGLFAQQYHPQTDPAPPAESPGWSAISESMHKMHAVMSAVVPSGNPDTDFVALMLPHHQGAIDMAKIELQYGHDPQMRRLAQEIVTDQQSEIELMNLWLKNHAHTSARERPTARIRAGQER